MYKIFLDKDSYNYLKRWSEEYKRYVLDCPAVANNFQVICRGEGHQDSLMYVQRKKYGYKYNFKTNNELIAKGKITRKPNGTNNFNITVDIPDNLIRQYYYSDLEQNIKDKALNETIPYMVNLYCNAFIMANAFLMYGNVIDEKNIIAVGKNENSNKVIVFRPFQEKLYAVPVGHHRSPEGVFEVRGHFRHYKKTNKIVWIDGYLKGTQKNRTTNLR